MTLQQAADILNRHRHNFVGSWQAYEDCVIQYYHGAVITQLTPKQAITIAEDYAKREKE